jgi:hypothetical protein
VTEGPPPDIFDQDLANTFIGKTILIGITYVDAAGREARHEQFHGVVESAGPAGIVIALRGYREGQRWTMPPDTRGIFPGNPGLYTLRSTGEMVDSPDLVSTWSIHDKKSASETH